MMSTSHQQQSINFYILPGRENNETLFRANQEQFSNSPISNNSSLSRFNPRIIDNRKSTPVVAEEQLAAKLARTVYFNSSECLLSNNKNNNKCLESTCQRSIVQQQNNAGLSSINSSFSTDTNSSSLNICSEKSNKVSSNQANNDNNNHNNNNNKFYTTSDHSNHSNHQKAKNIGSVTPRNTNSNKISFPNEHEPTTYTASTVNENRQRNIMPQHRLSAFNLVKVNLLFFSISILRNLLI